MIGETAELLVNIHAKDGLTPTLTKAQAGLTGLNRTAGVLSTSMTKVGGAFGHAKSQLGGLLSGPLGVLGITGGMIGLTAAVKGSVESATSFEHSMEMIQTQAGGTAEEVKSMSKAILDMAGSVGTAPEALAAGLYHIESSGIRGAKALDVLTTAAKGAKVGGADLEAVTNGLIATVTSGIGGISSMSQAMGVLNSIVGAGNMRMEDLVAAFSTGLLSSAKAAGVSIQSVGAAMADMTYQGVPAQDAATRLRMSLSLLAAPTSKAADILKAMGINQLDLANRMRGPGGIADAMSYLATKMRAAGLIDPNGNVNSKGFAALSGAFGGGRSSSAIITLLQSVGRLQEAQKQITAGADQFGNAWDIASKDAGFSFERLGATIGSMSIKIGNALLPTLQGLADSASKWLTEGGEKSIIGGMKAAIDVAKTLGSALGTVLTPLIGAWNTIPNELKTLLVGGFVANKATKWLFGSSIIDGIKGMANALRLLPGPLGAIGGAAGAATAIPVWVTNPGFGTPGGNLLPEAAAAAGAGGLAGLATVTAGVLGILGAYWLVQEVAKGNPAAKPRTVTSGPLAGTTLTATGPMSIDALSQGNPALARLMYEATGPAGERNYYHGQRGVGFSPEAGDTYSERAGQTLIDSGHSLTSAAGKLGSAGTAIIHAASLFHKAATIREKINVQFSGQVLGAYAKGDKRVSGSDVVTTASAVALALINKLRTPGDEKSDLKSANYQLKQMRADQKAAAARGDTKTAAALGVKINSLKAAINATTRAVNKVPPAISNIKLPGTTVIVNTTVSGRDVATTFVRRTLASGQVVLQGNRVTGGAQP